jgi:hypothetical protein
MILAGARRRRVALFLAAVATVAAALAVLAQFTGGFRTHVFGLPLSVRGASRPALVALVLGIAALHLLDAWRSRRWAAIATRLHHAPPIVALVAAVAFLITGVIYGTKAAGGSDVYGYVSQAMLWLRGDLIVPQPFIADFPWPNAAWSFSPLGYRPDDWAHTIKPTYAPGTPLLMALGYVVFGQCGPFLVGPACGAALVLLTYALGSRVSGRGTGVIASGAIAVSPTVVFMANWPMSDVPCATFWTASLLAATGRRRRWALVAGAMAGVAILIRPNLAPLAAFPALLLLVKGAPTGTRYTSVVLFGLGCLPFVAFVAWLFNYLYGSPFRSGYGDLSGLYAWSHGVKNLKLYSGWFLDTQGPFPLLFLASPLVILWRRGQAMTERLILFAFAMLTLGAYLFYAPFEIWTYLRFLLPAFPIVFILATDVVSQLARGWPRWAGYAGAVVFGAIVIGSAASATDNLNVLVVGEAEQKYADVGRYVDTALPKNAVVIAQQHGGNVRYYAGRLTVRFDLLDPTWLDRTLAMLRAKGLEPYILLEEWELKQFRERFAGQGEAAALDRAPLAVTLDGFVRLYATGAATSRASAIIPKTTGCVHPHPSWGFGPYF